MAESETHLVAMSLLELLAGRFCGSVPSAASLPCFWVWLIAKPASSAGLAASASCSKPLATCSSSVAATGAATAGPALTLPGSTAAAAALTSFSAYRECQRFCTEQQAALTVCHATDPYFRQNAHLRVGVAPCEQDPAAPEPAQRSLLLHFAYLFASLLFPRHQHLPLPRCEAPQLLCAYWPELAERLHDWHEPSLH